MARAIIVAKAKDDKDPQYKNIVKHERPMQTRLAQFQFQFIMKHIIVKRILFPQIAKANLRWE